MIDQKELLILIKQYEAVDVKVIKTNIVKYIKQSKMKSQEIANKMNVSIQTIYLWRQVKKNYKIEFSYAVKLAEILKINIKDLMGKED